MMQVNLLPWRQQRRQARWQQLMHITGAALLLLAVVMLAGWGLLHQRAAAWAARQAVAASQLQALQQQATQRQALVDRHASLIQQAHAARQRQQARRRHLRLLEEIEHAIPAGVWLTHWQEQAGAVHWQGLAYRYDRVLAFAAALRQGREAVAVTLENIRQQPDGLFHFGLQATWKVKEQDDLLSATDRGAVAAPAAPATGGRGLAAAFIAHWHRLPGTAAAQLAAG